MSVLLRFEIPGEPAPKGSRVTRLRADGTATTRPASKREKPWRTMASRALWVQAQEQRVNLTGPIPLAVSVLFLSGRPARPSHPYPTRFDLDKALRNLFDAIVQAGVISDDRHIIDTVAFKRFTTGPPRTLGSIQPANLAAQDPWDLSFWSLQRLATAGVVA